MGRKKKDGSKCNTCVFKVKDKVNPHEVCTPVEELPMAGPGRIPIQYIYRGPDGEHAGRYYD